MKGFVRRLPIKQKLVFMIMSTTIPVLVLGSVGYISLDYFSTRQAIRRDLTAQADHFPKQWNLKLGLRW